MKYFTFFELEYSEKAVKRGIKNKPTPQAEENLRLLVERLLDPLRERYGKPITINSGYRNAEVNRLVGGVSGSQHLTGCAADISAGSKAENQHLARLIVQYGLPFDQLIDEHGYAWVHVSISPNGYNRRQILRIDSKGSRKITEAEL